MHDLHTNLCVQVFYNCFWYENYNLQREIRWRKYCNTAWKAWSIRSPAPKISVRFLEVEQWYFPKLQSVINLKSLRIKTVFWRIVHLKHILTKQNEWMNLSPNNNTSLRQRTKLFPPWTRGNSFKSPPENNISNSFTIEGGFL